MKKLGDTLRMLSSVLLGIVIRDSDSVTKALQSYFSQGGRPEDNVAKLAAWLTPLIMTAVFVRNLHGSAQYDAFVEDMKFWPSFEKYAFGRFCTFLMAVAGLFLGPFLADHLLANHLTELSQLQLGTGLFCPILVYTFWDGMLWLGTSEWATGPRQMHEVAWRWLVIDACGLLVVLGLCLSGLRAGAKGLPADLSTICFIVVACGTVLADYIWNSRFYFPPHPASRP